jgi:hypothetical protein
LANTPHSPLAQMIGHTPSATHDDDVATPSAQRTRRGGRNQFPPLYSRCAHLFSLFIGSLFKAPSRLSILATLLSLTWFITAHILVFTSIHTCRYASPHLWWLTFAVICITYLSVFEVVIIGEYFLASAAFLRGNNVCHRACPIYRNADHLPYPQHPYTPSGQPSSAPQ